MIANIDPVASREPKITLASVEALAARLADSTNALDETLSEFQRELQAVNDKYLRPLKKLAAETAMAEAELHGAIERAPQLFEKPKTLTMHGLKFGFSYSKGKLVWDDEATVIKLLRKRFKGEEELLATVIRTTEEVNKDGVKALKLDTDELARLGMRIEGEGDDVLIDRAAGDIEKLLARLKNKLVEAMVGAE